MIAPENTLAAFLAARRLGADGIELDVFRCSSGEMVVTHDDDLAIWSNGRGRVSETPLAALKELDFGSHFSSQFAGEPIPTLQEVIDAMGEEMFINIEIKTLALRPLAEAQTVAATIAANNLYHRVLVSSFNPLALHYVKRQDGRISTGLLFHYRFPVYMQRPLGAALLKMQALHPEARLATTRMIERAHACGYMINTWTVNEVEEMRKFIELGVDGIITDYPDRLKTVMAEYPAQALVLQR